MRNLDRPLGVLTLLLVALGLAALFIAVRSEPGSAATNPGFIRQLAGAGAGMVAMCAIARVPFETLKRSARFFYVVSILTLAATPFIAPTIRGARAWIVAGPFRFQPGELAKPAVALMLAVILSRTNGRPATAKSLAAALAVGGIPMLLLMAQPDLGTALAFGALVVGVPYLAGLPNRHLFYGGIAAVTFGGRLVLGIGRGSIGPLDSPGALILTDPAAGVTLFAAGGAGVTALALAARMRGFSLSVKWPACMAISAIAYFASFAAEESLKPYQRARILSFIDPQSDPRGAAYNVLQSLIAIGSGGIWGRGAGGASQTGLGFLPERQTDFIFSVIGESFGFAGTAVTLFLYTALLLRILAVGERAGGAEALYAGGIAALLLFHLGINVGMTLGLAPVVGIPLPLLSYGGSSMLSTLIALGIVQSIAAERNRIKSLN